MRPATKPPRARSAKGLGVFALGMALGLGTAVADIWLSRRRPRAAPALASPTDLPARGWRDVAWRTWKEFNADHIPAVAGGATFFALLALFPGLGIVVSLYGLFGDLQEARHHIMQLPGILPGGAIVVLNEQLTRLAAAPPGRLSATFLLSLLLSLWSTNAGVKSLIAGLNIAYDQQEARGFLRLNLLSLGLTVGFVALAVIAAALPVVFGRLGLHPGPVIGLLRWPVLLMVLIAILSVFYRYAPCRAHARWRWITPGSVFAAIAWVIMSGLFTLYVANFGNYDRTYGSLGAVVGFMTWIWLSLTVVLMGAELNSELEQSTPSGKSTNPS